MEKINGAELVTRVLQDPNGSVEKLLQLAEYRETDWLELKAALLPEEYEVVNGRRKYRYKQGWNGWKKPLPAAN
jgi:hypothetical protein